MFPLSPKWHLSHYMYTDTVPPLQEIKKLAMKVLAVKIRERQALAQAGRANKFTGSSLDRLMREHQTTTLYCTVLYRIDCTVLL